MNNLYVVRMTNDAEHINLEDNSGTIIVWGPSSTQVEAVTATYESEGYWVMENWEVEDTAENRAVFVGPFDFLADEENDDHGMPR